MSDPLIRSMLVSLLLGSPMIAEEPSTVTFTKKTLTDRDRKIDTALTVMIPQGWNVSGGPKWYPRFVHQVSFEVRIENPQATERVEFLPTYWFTHSPENLFPPRPLDSYMGQVWLEPHNATDMLEKITIPGFRNSFKPTVTQREELKELAKAFRRDDGQTVQAGRVRIEYQERGTTYEEDFIIVLTYYTLKTTFGTIINWSPAIMPMAIRAKKGQLDPQRATLMSIALSLRPTPEYYKTIRLAQTRFIGNMAEFQRLDRMDAAAIDKSRADLQAITQSIWKERGESQDRTYQTRNDLLGGVAPYQGRDREFILPHSHKFTWSSDDGTTVILTNDPNYDPNIGSRDGWQKLSVVKR